MKIFIALIALIGATNFAHAAQEKSKNICDRFMTCGTYVSPEIDRGNGPLVIKIVIASTGDLTGTFDYIITDKAGKSSTWPLVATFTEEGVGTLRWKGQEKDEHNGIAYATVICEDTYCNYALVPFEDEKGKWGNAGIMRFTGTTLEFMMTVGTPTAYRSSDMILQKQ